MSRTTSRTRLSGARRALVAVVGVALAAGGLVTLGASSASASDSGMFGQVNSSRSAHGKHALRWSSHLADVAAGQAARMAKKHLLYHNPNLASDVGSFRWVGENVGYGPSSDVIENAFMNSPAHRANILDSDYTEIGVASVRDSKGRLWVAQVFRQPIGGSSTVTKKKHAPSKPRHKATKPRAGSTTHSGDATADPSPTPAPAHKPKPRVASKPAVPKPAPVPTLADRVSYAQSQAPASSSDPLSDSLAFAATMHAVAG